jgi:DMSO/TMAO reductase YedYZ heme-binding membrane subunit
MDTRLLIELVPVLNTLVVVCVGGLVWRSEQKRPPKAKPKTSRVAAWLMPHIRRLVFSVVVIWAMLVYIFGAFRYQSTPATAAFLTRAYGLSALILFLLVFIPGLVRVFLPRARFKDLLIQARQALGLGTFLLACLHLSFAYFYNLAGSLRSVLYLAGRYQWALVFAVLAFAILLSMATSDLPFIDRRLGKYWKWIHRFVYLAALSVVVHAVLIGSSFTQPNHWTNILLTSMALDLLLLETAATLIEIRRRKEWPQLPWRLTAFVLCVVCVAAPIVQFRLLTAQPYNPHAKHQGSFSTNYVATLSSVPTQAVPGQAASLNITITDASTSQLVQQFDEHQTKLMHLIIVSDDLKYYDHLHPDYKGNGHFSIGATFPQAGTYYLYASYVPQDAAEQFSLMNVVTAGAGPSVLPILGPPTTQASDDTYTAVLSGMDKIRAGQVATPTFTIRDTRSGAIPQLDPYLDAYGHLAVISSDLRTYLHIHPNLTGLEQQRGQARLQFVTSFSRPGRYKLFLQFQVDGESHVIPFVAEVEQ